MISRCNSCKHYQMNNDDVCSKCGANDTMFYVDEIGVLADIANMMRDKNE